jgi:AraC family transcriptional regulator
MKRTTLARHRQIANDALYYIYRYIDTDIHLGALADELEVGRHHLHRVFKEQMGLNLNEMIRSIRLQKAANLLITNTHATISEVALQCGYSSHATFIRVFRERFEMTPSSWRRGGYHDYAQTIVQHATMLPRTFEGVQPRIVRTAPIRAHYLRHHGYTPAIAQVWQQLQTWIHTHAISHYRTIALYHDNPVVTPPEACYYVASVAVKEGEWIGETSLPSFEIPGGVHAVFELEGVYGDMLGVLRWVYHEWLSASGYETTTLPAYTIFYRNHFLEEGGGFRATFYLPIRWA